MILTDIQMESSACSSYRAEVKFDTNDPGEVEYLLKHTGREFTAIARYGYGCDGLRAKCTTVDNYRELKTSRATKDKVVFNPPATILWRNGKKYVSKAHNEEFDEEKGLLMCLAKANGITHLELKRMIKDAKRCDKNKKKGEK